MRLSPLLLLGVVLFLRPSFADMVECERVLDLSGGAFAPVAEDLRLGRPANDPDARWTFGYEVLGHFVPLHLRGSFGDVEVDAQGLVVATRGHLRVVVGRLTSPLQVITSEVTTLAYEVELYPRVQLRYVERGRTRYWTITL